MTNSRVDGSIPSDGNEAGPLDRAEPGPAPPAPKSRAQRQAETREQLLDAALVVFTERGFHGATLDEIARHAGYTKGAVYANFADKEDLFLAVVDRRIDHGVQSLSEVEALTHAGEITDEEVPEVIEQQFQIRWALLALEAVMYAVRERPELLAEFAKRYRHIDAHTTRFLQTKAADPPEAIEALAIGQNALGEGLMIRHMIEPERITHEVIDRVYTAVFDPAHRRAWREDPASPDPEHADPKETDDDAPR